MASTSSSTTNQSKKRQSVDTTVATTSTDPRFTFSASDLSPTEEGEPTAKSYAKQSNLPAHLLPKSSTSSAPTPGLIYLSRIPPGMGPSKVKSILSSYGDVGRVFLVKVDAGLDKQQSSSKKKGSQQHSKHESHRFKEGWVEFLDKKVARSVAEMLNANTIGGKKSSPYHDDVWTMKYLPKFRWDMLSEQVALERATQTSLLRFHLQHSKAEQENYLNAVEKHRVGEKIREKREVQGTTEEKKRKKAKTQDGQEGGDKKEGRKYRQRELVDVEQRFKKDGDAAKLEGVLGKLF